MGRGHNDRLPALATDLVRREVAISCRRSGHGGKDVATGLAALTFLRRGQVVLEEPYISVYGGYATRLLRLQLDLIQALDKHRRSHKQTVQAGDVHIHSGARGWSAS